MISTAILNLLYGLVFLLTYPIRSLSDVSLNSNIATSLTTASGYYHTLDTYLPVGTLITILGVSLTFELAYLTYKVIMWVIKKIPTIN